MMVYIDREIPEQSIGKSIQSIDRPIDRTSNQLTVQSIDYPIDKLTIRSKTSNQRQPSFSLITFINPAKPHFPEPCSSSPYIISSKHSGSKQLILTFQAYWFPFLLSPYPPPPLDPIALHIPPLNIHHTTFPKSQPSFFAASSLENIRWQPQS